MWHGSTPNVTADRSRHIMQVHYCSVLISHRLGAPWLPPAERPILSAAAVGSSGLEPTTQDPPEDPGAESVAVRPTLPSVLALANARQRRLLAGFE